MLNSSVKKMALAAAMVAFFASSSEAVPLKAHHHSCTIPFPDATIYVVPAIESWHTIVAGLNNVYVAGAYASNPNSTHVSNLISAETGVGQGSIGQAIAVFQNTLLNLNANATLVSNIGAQIQTFDNAAIAYALSVYNNASHATQVSNFNYWQSTGVVLANLLTQLSPNQSFNVINDYLSNIIEAQGQGIQAYFGVLQGVSAGADQSVIAVALNAVSHENASSLAAYVVGQLISYDNCTACDHS